MGEINCAVCKKEINNSANNQKICRSDECKKAHRRASKKAYRKTDKYKAYQKVYQKAYKETDKYKAYCKTDKYKAYQRTYQKEYHMNKKEIKKVLDDFEKELLEKRISAGKIHNFIEESKNKPKKPIISERDIFFVHERVVFDFIKRFLKHAKIKSKEKIQDE